MGLIPLPSSQAQVFSFPWPESLPGELVALCSVEETPFPCKLNCSQPFSESPDPFAQELSLALLPR